MKLAVLGDVHGQFGAAAELLTAWMDTHGERLDGCLQVGDLMPIRHAVDMEFAAAFEKKYRYPGDFAQFSDDTAERRLFPVPLFFIGGNHDPWNWLDEHPAGDWLTDWLYFFGRATSTDHQGLNICAISGIWHPKKSLVADRQLIPKTHTAADRKEYTYTTQGEIAALIKSQLTDIPCDILLLHDWPTGLDRRPFVGSPGARLAIEQIRPKRVFCGHMHRYAEGTIAGSPVICLNAVAGPDAEIGPAGGPALYVFDPGDPASGAAWMP